MPIVPSRKANRPRCSPDKERVADEAARTAEGWHEPEAGVRRRLVGGAMRHDEHRPGKRVVPPHPPAASYIPRPTTPDAIVETSSSKNSQGHNGSDIDLPPKTIKAGPTARVRR
jgi:hypothetical protein